MSSTSGPVTVINVFTPQPGRIDEFLQMQTEALARFRGRVDGLRGSRLFRALDGRNAIQVSMFESREALERFTGSDAFASHRDRVMPLLEQADPSLYELVYEAGNITAGAAT